MLLEEYAQRNGFQNTLFFYDDGYSGTNFDRPSWKKVLELIEAGQVATLIVKDMSRLGREYLQVGYYTEIYFPEKDIRFIAVNDNVDSLVAGSDDFNGIRKWFTEQHARDTSKKVRVVKKLQAERGERLGGRPPYGYKKKDADSKDIIPDEDAAPIVQRIFQLCAAGKGPNQIARILREEKALTPGHYYYHKYGKTHAKLDLTAPYSWSNNTVVGILDNVTYLGKMAGLRSTTLSYKNKKHILRPENEQVVVEGTHEALITQEQWDIVQELRQRKKGYPSRWRNPTSSLDWSSALTVVSPWFSTGPAP